MTIFQHFSEAINSATNFITFIIIVRDKVLIKYIITMLTIHKRNRFPIENVILCLFIYEINEYELIAVFFVNKDINSMPLLKDYLLGHTHLYV